MSRFPDRHDLVVSQSFEHLPVIVIRIVLDPGAHDDLPVVDPGLRPQAVDPPFPDHPLEVVREPIGIAVTKLVLPEPGSGPAKPDPRLRDDAELSLPTPHRIEEIRVPGARATYRLAGSGHHLELLDLIHLQPVAMGGGPEPAGGEGSAHRRLGDVHEHPRERSGAVQRVHHLPPERPALRPHEVPTEGPDPIEARRVDDQPAVREALTALGVSASPYRDPGPVRPGPTDGARYLLDALRPRHRRRDPSRHSSEVVRMGVRSCADRLGFGTKRGSIISFRIQHSSFARLGHATKKA